jgi:uncharacterized membrane protein YhaH (DUF805 family)
VATTAGSQRMNRKSYLLATAIVFSVIGLIHLLRIILGWEAVIGGWTVPLWLSWLALIVSAAFAHFGFTHARSDK